jgi:hypothetical protein
MRSIAGNGIFGFGYNIGTNLVLSFDDKKLMVLAITGLWRLSELVFGSKRTCPTQAKTSAFDLYRKSYHGAKARICLGLSIVVDRRGPHAAT